MVSANCSFSGAYALITLFSVVWPETATQQQPLPRGNSSQHHQVCDCTRRLRAAFFKDQTLPIGLIDRLRTRSASGEQSALRPRNSAWKVPGGSRNCRTANKASRRKISTACSKTFHSVVEHLQRPQQAVLPRRGDERASSVVCSARGSVAYCVSVGDLGPVTVLGDLQSHPSLVAADGAPAQPVRDSHPSVESVRLVGERPCAMHGRKEPAVTRSARFVP